MTGSELNRKSKIFGSNFFGRVTSSSSITGIKYIGDRESPRLVRSFWICAFILSTLGVIYYVLQIYDKWYITPEMGIRITYEPSASIPFPAITICPQTKIKKEYLNYGDALRAAFNNGSGEFINDESRQYFESTLQLCTTSHVMLINESFVNDATLDGNEYVNTMSQTGLKINETVLGLKIKSGFFAENFEVFLDRVITSEGFCVTYNMQDYATLFKEDSGLDDDFDSYKNGRKSSWDPHKGYLLNDHDIFPTRIFSGSNNAVVFLLVQNKHDIDEACFGPVQGFKFFFHMPNEIPSYANNSFILMNAKSKRLSMKTKSFRTREDLKRFHPEKRNCYFNDENKLNFFKSYTQTHCELECRSNFMLEKCGCVKFFMPRNNSTPVCNISLLTCAEEAEELYIDHNFIDGKLNCNCIPLCTQIKYDIHSIFDMDFDTNNTLRSFGDNGEFYNEFPTGIISRLSVEFPDSVSEVQENFSMYELQHFISDCGGLLGLFMGCSVLSIVEICFNILEIIIYRKLKNDIQDLCDVNSCIEGDVVICIENSMDDNLVKKAI